MVHPYIAWRRKQAAMWGVVAALFVLIGAVGWAWWQAGATLPGSGDAKRVVIVFAVPDAQDVETAAFVAVIDVSEGVEAEVLDSRAKVAVPGTSYDELGEAYAFGGGKGVAAAAARLAGDERPLHWIAIEHEALTELVDSVGGVTIDVPASMNVYVSGSLHLFELGEREMRGTEYAAYLVGLRELGDDVRKRALVEAASALAAAYGGGVPGPIPVDAETSMNEEQLAQFVSAVTIGVTEAEIR